MMGNMDLAKMLKEAGVVRRGKFKLTGGGSADFYIDVKKVMGSPRAFAAVVRQLCACSQEIDMWYNRAMTHLAKIDDILEKNDVVYAGLFGSFARGEEGPDSDIDILVRFGKPKNLFDLVHIQKLLSMRCKRKIDLVTEGALSPYTRKFVMQDLQDLYGHR